MSPAPYFKVEYLSRWSLFSSYRNTISPTPYSSCCLGISGYRGLRRPVCRISTDNWLAHLTWAEEQTAKIGRREQGNLTMDPLRKWKVWLKLGKMAPDRSRLFSRGPGQRAREQVPSIWFWQQARTKELLEWKGQVLSAWGKYRDWSIDSCCKLSQCWDIVIYYSCISTSLQDLRSSSIC